MRRLLFVLFIVFAACAPTAALADGTPPPAAVAACKAEYQQLGADAFKAKYGPEEPFGHCYAAHAGAPEPQPQPSPPSAEGQCKAEYVQLGPDAFKAKYGADEPYRACLTAHGATAPAPATTPKSGDVGGGVSDAPKYLAQMLCKAEGKSVGKDAFVAKYGKEALGQCVKATLAKARALVASCKSSSGSSKDAFKACLAAALAGAQPKRR